MADRVDTMSDAELRTKLAEHGFPVMPVTASTRKLLVKKLKLVLDNKSATRNGSASSEARRSLAKYSSGEDSDLDAEAGKSRRGRRATTGGALAMPPPSAARTRRPTPKKDSPKKVPVEEDQGSESEDEVQPIKTHEEVETVTTRRITRMFKPSDEYETGSDSDVDGDKRNSSLRNDSRSSDYVSSTLAPSLSRASPPRPSYLPSRPTLSTGFTSSLSGTESLNSIRSRLGLSSGFGDTPLLSTARQSTSFSRTYKPSAGVDEVESPYLSNFAKRLSTLSEPPRPLVERDNGVPSYVRKPYISSAARPDADYKLAADRKFLRSNIVSLALVAFVALFFFFLFSMYLFRKNDVATIVDDKSSVVPECKLNIPGNRPGINCVPKEQISYAMNLLKLLRPELNARASAYKCGEEDASPFLTDKEILEIAGKSAIHDDPGQIRVDLNNLQVLVMHNPQWGLSIVEMKDVYSQGSDHTTLKKMDEVIKYRQKGNAALIITNHPTPLSCLLTSTFYSAGASVALIAVLLAIGYGAQKAGKYYMAYRKQKNDEVFSMVEQIIDVISQENEDNGEPYMSVDHVRDILISPHNRDRLASVWEAAIEYIKKKESRVRMEVQSVDGEECQVWRWVSPRTGSPRVSGPAWQGQAFETQEGSVNNLSVSPTPCLKIRHMFDKNEANPELRRIIQDAILEKAGDQCKILHIDLDRATCCVYVKCASQKDAGVVYKSLHGWWYEGKLITVKYLRLERYMVRFPNSPLVGPYLKPSRIRHSNWNE